MSFKTSGTKEWSDWNLNFQTGCKHACIYCFGMFDAVSRWKRCPSYKDWYNNITIREKVVNTKFRKRKGRGMIPTTHDIYPENQRHGLKVIKQLCRSGNEVLITTKPHLETIIFLCGGLLQYKDLIQFRFTITGINDYILELWEPFAPKYDERIEALLHACYSGFKTSVSIEPYLCEPLQIIKDVEPYTTESIWVGLMNKTKLLPWVKMFYHGIEYLYKEKYVINNIDKWVSLSKRKFRAKDSIQNLIGCDLYGINY